MDVRCIRGHIQHCRRTGILGRIVIGIASGIAKADDAYPRVLNRHLIDEAFTGVDGQTVFVKAE